MTSSCVTMYVFMFMFWINSAVWHFNYLFTEAMFAL